VFLYVSMVFWRYPVFSLQQRRQLFLGCQL